MRRHDEIKSTYIREKGMQKILPTFDLREPIFITVNEFFVISFRGKKGGIFNNGTERYYTL